MRARVAQDHSLTHSLKTGMLLSRLHSSRHALPPPYAGADENVLASWTAVPIIGKRLNLVSYISSSRPRQSGIVSAIVLGDSYCDDIDMGYLCWPALLAQRRGWSMINAARGGSVARQGASQYEQALAFATEAGLQVNGSTLIMVHLGGNNLLHALWLGPIAAMLLLMDVAHISLGLLGCTRRLASLPRFSFVGVLARGVMADLGKLVRMLGGKGHARVLVSGLPLCAAVPTMRAVLGLLLWPLWPLGLCGGARRRGMHGRAVSAVATAFAALAQTAIKGHLEAEAVTAGIDLVFFDEAAAIDAVHDEVRSGRLPAMWKDGHHPNSAAHARLAAYADEQLQAAPDALSRTKSTPTPAARSHLKSACARRRNSPPRI